MISISTLEEQVRTASLKNRMRRGYIVGRCRLFRHEIESAAGKPVVLGAAVLIGFGFGLRESHKPAVHHSNSAAMAKILSLVMNYFAHSARRNMQVFD